MEERLEDRLHHIKTPLSLSVLGCVVNGPGEARETDIGITGGGAGKHMVYLAGVTDHHVQDADMLDHIVSLVEAKKLGIPSIGIEANPVVHFAASVKTDWDVDPRGLEDYAKVIAEETQAIFNEQGIDYGPLFRPANAEPVALKLNPVCLSGDSSFF